MVITLSAFSQRNYEIQVYYGFPTAQMRWTQDLTGIASTELSQPVDIGLRYKFQLNNRFGLFTGLQYFQTTKIINISGGGMPIAGPTRFEEPLEILSIPVLVEYGFLKYLYLAAGPQIDIQLTDDRYTSQDQDGIGYIVGLGGRVQREKLSFFVFPNFSRHSWIPFKNREFSSRQVLEVFSLQMGVGYSF